MKKLPKNLVILLLSLFVPGIACNVLCAQVNLEKVAVSGGGHKTSTESQSVNMTIGQSLSAKVQVSNKKAHVGFWFVIDDQNTGILDPDSIEGLKSADLNVYPNPFDTQALAEFNIRIYGRVILLLTDMEGKEITRFYDSILPPGKYKVPIDGLELNQSLYVLTLWTERGMLHRKLVVVN